MFLHPALYYSRKISMFSTMKKRRFSGTLVVEEDQSVVGAKTRQLERLITPHGARARKEVIWSEQLHRIQEVIATTVRPLGVH